MLVRRWTEVDRRGGPVNAVVRAALTVLLVAVALHVAAGLLLPLLPLLLSLAVAAVLLALVLRR